MKTAKISHKKNQYDINTLLFTENANMAKFRGKECVISYDALTDKRIKDELWVLILLKNGIENIESLAEEYGVKSIGEKIKKLENLKYLEKNKNFIKKKVMPTWEIFRKFALEIEPKLNEELLKIKYESWEYNDMDGNGVKIKNWKNKTRNCILFWRVEGKRWMNGKRIDEERIDEEKKVIW